MKKHYLFLIAFLSFSFHVSAQNIQNFIPDSDNGIFLQNPKNLKSANELVYLIDSMISYRTTDDDGWEISNKTFYTYDERGNNIDNTTSIRDINSGIYEPSYRNTFIFSENNIKQHYYQFNWNSTTSLWDSAFYHQYFYDESGRIKEDVSTKFDLSAKKWNFDYSRQSKYDENGMNIEIILNKWDQEQSEWKNLMDYILTYDENGFLTERMNNKWDAASSSYQNNTKSINTRDANNFVVENVVKKWDKTTSTWGNYRYYKYTNGENGLPENYVLQTWNSESSVYENTLRRFYKYDEFNNMIEYIPEYWDKNRSAWIRNSKNVYFYSQHEKDNTGVVEFENQMNIYPNPAQNILHVANIAEPSVITIHNIEGKLVVQREVNTNKITFNLNNFNAGLYLLKISNSSGTQIAKFIKR